MVPADHAERIGLLRKPKITPRGAVVCENLLVSQLAKKFTEFYGTRMFITVLTRSCHFALS
jgi:hypothetical protein